MIQICPECGKEIYSTSKYGVNFCSWCGGILNIEMARRVTEDNENVIENYNKDISFFKGKCKEHAFKYCKQFNIECNEENYITYCNTYLDFSQHYKTYNAYKEMLKNAIKMQRIITETTKTITKKLENLENIQVIENTQLKLLVA